MLYPATLEANGAGGYIARFADVSEALTEGASREDAIREAADALSVALLGRMKDGEDIPSPSKGGRDAVMVAVPAQVASKLAFYTAFRQSGMSRSALARAIGKDEAEVRRMLDPHHQTKLPAIEQALLAMGKRLIITMEPA